MDETFPRIGKKISAPRDNRYQYKKSSIAHDLIGKNLKEGIFVWVNP
jgi:hypothetical protein